MAGVRQFVSAVRSDPPRLARWVIGVLLGVGTIIRVPQLFHTLDEAYAFRQTQTAFTVREYGEHGINLLTSPLPVFGPHASVPMEFPLFQGIAALLLPLGITPDMASRVIGLIAFQCSAILLAMLLTRWHGRQVAVLAVGLYEFLPYGLLWGSASLIDFFAVALALLMVVGIDRWFVDGSKGWLIVGSVGAVLGFLVKVTTAPSWVILLIASAVIVIRERGWLSTWRRLLVGFVVGPGLGLVLAVGWSVYADSIKRAQPLTGFLTSAALQSWNFGTLKQRLDPQNYLTILNHIAEEIAGPALIGLLIAVIAAVFLRSAEQRLRTLAFIVALASAPLVFFNLYVVHTYYLIAIYPAAAAAMAIGGVWALRQLRVARWQRATIGVLAIVALFFTTADTTGGRSDLAQFLTSQPRPALSSLLLADTKPSDQIILIGCDWDPTFLYYAERTGVMFRDQNSAGFWDTNKIDDYQYLYSCNGTLSPKDYLPAGYEAVKTGSPNFYRVKPD
jgi:hypothetical protein